MEEIGYAENSIPKKDQVQNRCLARFYLPSKAYVIMHIKLLWLLPLLLLIGITQKLNTKIQLIEWHSP